MKVSFVFRTACLAALASMACSFRTLDDELTAQQGENASSGGPSTGGAPAVTSGRAAEGGNGLTRPPSGGQSGGADPGAQPSPSSEGGALSPPSPDEPAGAGVAGGAPNAAGSCDPPGSPTGGAAGAVGGNGSVGGASAGAGASGGCAGDGGSSAEVEPVIPAIPEIFFSEYVEGSSNNKALEVCARVDGSLDGCVIRVYLNGAESPSATVALTGDILAAEPYVICDSGFSEPSRCDLVKALRFNGNDVVELSCREEILDVIGQTGEPPKERWGTSELGTLDQTLRRKCDIRSGDSDSSDPFDPAVEWTAAEKDAFDDLGKHCSD